MNHLKTCILIFHHNKSGNIQTQNIRLNYETALTKALPVSDVDIRRGIACQISGQVGGISGGRFDMALRVIRLIIPSGASAFRSVGIAQKVRVRKRAEEETRLS